MNPHLGELLSRIRMDKRFVQGEGCYLYDVDGRQYLDFISGYGALPFGFNPPEIWDALHEVQRCGEPSFAQPSLLEAAGELAERLVALAPGGLNRVTFTNSGTESVEAAIKLCRAATGRLGILSAANSFHGKTLGALSATNRESYQRAFGVPLPGYSKVEFGDLEALEKELNERGQEIAALLLEPIQGEGGVISPPPGYLATVRELCRKYGVLLVLDEIQTGLGRTGFLFACEAERVVPDVMVLSKTLGGGLFPIGAVLCSEAAYSEEFALKHSSTFAGNTLAARVGLRSLELLTRDDQALVRQVAANGAYLQERLGELQRRYPHVLRNVRGRGFLLGLEFAVDMATFGRTSLLGVLAEQESLTPVLSSYLLNVCGLRVAPTLNGASVIRIEPPLITTREQCDVAVTALDEMLRHLAGGNTAELLGHLLDIESRPQRLPVLPRREPPRPADTPDEGRFAFLVNPVDLQNYVEMDQSLQVFSTEELGLLAERWNEMLEPFVLSSARICSRNGKTAYGEFIAVPRTAGQLLQMEHEQALSLVRRAVDLAVKGGAKIVGLGAYTSVVTRGGLHLRAPGVAITTGNSYTVVAAVDAISQAATKVGVHLSQAIVAVLGATGAIGRATALLMAEQVRGLTLIGNPARPEQSRKRLVKVAAEICRHLADLAEGTERFEPGSLGEALLNTGLVPKGEGDLLPAVQALEAERRIIITTDPEAELPEADVVVTATSSLENLITPRSLKTGAVVCDLSRPSNVSQAVSLERPDVLVIDGGIVAVPGAVDLGWNFGFEPGLAYACMAETVILSLDKRYQNTSIGTDLNLSTIRELRALGAEQGFRLAQLRSFDRPLSDEAWATVLAARNQRTHLATGH